MDNALFVAPGDPWQPESAARFNAVSELLNRSSGGLDPFLPAGGMENMIRVRNVSGETVKAFHFVQIGSPLAGDLPAMDNVFSAAPGVSGVVGVMQENCPPGGESFARIHGPAFVCAGELRSPQGAAEIRCGDGRIVLLGAGKTAAGAYDGYFKVSAAASDEQQRITKLLVSEGVTDLPGNRTVAPVSFDIDPGKNFEVILVLERSEEGPRSRLKNTVILAPGETVTSAAFEREYQSRFVLLASVVNTGENPGIIQRWTDNVVYWGSRFFI